MSESKQLFVTQVKSGNTQLEFEEVKLDEFKSLESPSLVYATKEKFLFKTVEKNSMFNLHLFNKQSLLKKYENLNSFNLANKESSYFLVYAKYLSNSVMKFKMCFIKSYWSLKF